MNRIAAVLVLAAGFIACDANAVPTTDLNGDTRSDIVYRNTANGQGRRLLMNGFTVTNAASAFNEPDIAWKPLGAGDFNGDGNADLLYRHDVTGLVKMFLFGAAGVAVEGRNAYSEPNLAWKVVQTPDLDGDGKADLVWWNSTTGQVYLMLMNGSAIRSQGTVYNEPNRDWRIVASGDFSGSGKENQLLWRNIATGQVYLMTVATGPSGFSQTGTLIYTEPDTAWKIVGAADFNNDFRTDILWRNDVDGRVYMMLMNGAVIASAGTVYAEPDLAWKIVAQGDYNGNGRADILYRNDATGRVYMMLMNGLAIASAGMVYEEPDTHWKVLGPPEFGIEGIAQGPDFTRCAAGFTPPSEPLTAVLGGYGNPLIHLQKSQQTLVIPLPAILAPDAHSGTVSFSESINAQTPQPVTVEFSINKCPTLIEPPTANASSGQFCNVLSTNGSFNSITWFGKPIPGIRDKQSAGAYGYCWAGDPGSKYYISARWTYNGCANNYYICGFAIQHNQGPY